MNEFPRKENMKTGIFLLARMGSQRLPGKHLLQAREKPMLQHLINRIFLEFTPEIRENRLQIVITTSDESSNSVFEQLTNVSVFYGAVHNIPLRALQAAKESGFDQFLLVDGDDILCSTQGMRAVFEKLEKGASYVATKGLPFGMNSQGFRTNFYEEAVRPALTPPVLETGWGRVFPAESCQTIIYEPCPQQDSVRFSLDYPEDFTLIKGIIDHFGDRLPVSTHQEIVEYTITSSLYHLTEQIMKEYWDRFYAQIQEENK